jgi:hypothetical protein
LLGRASKSFESHLTELQSAFLREHAVNTGLFHRFLMLSMQCVYGLDILLLIPEPNACQVDISKLLASLYEVLFVDFL